MPTIVDGVNFNTIAREWRCKWSKDSGMKSLQEVQKAMLAVLPEIQQVGGALGVQRIVCGGCYDFKVITSLPANKWGDWEKAQFAPEEKFLSAIKSIDGVINVETQTYTIKDLMQPPRFDSPGVTQITDGVTFDTVAREWRCKWSPDNDKKSLKYAQKLLVKCLDQLTEITGVLTIQRIVCGGCHDFKVILAFPAGRFSAWEKKGFPSETEFLEQLEAIDGISQVETQTYTLMPAWQPKVPFLASYCIDRDLGLGSQPIWQGDIHTSLWIDAIGAVDKGEVLTASSAGAVKPIPVLTVEDIEVEGPQPPVYSPKFAEMIPMKKITIKVDHGMTCPDGWKPGDDESTCDYIKYIYAKDKAGEIRVCAEMKPHTQPIAVAEVVVGKDDFEALTPYAYSTKHGLWQGETVAFEEMPF